MAAAGAITYLTADGLLEPIGFSQVVRVIEGLARRGWRYCVFSLERRADLARESAVRDVRQRLESAGIEWKFDEYAVGGSARDALRNEGALVSAAVSTARKGARGLHARAYHGGVAALAAWYASGTPWIFDARSYWFDERLEENRWFTSPLRLAVARGVEHQLFSRSSAVVTLTELQADDVRNGRFGVSRHRAVRCITTCADFADFRPRPVVDIPAVPQALRERFLGKRLLGVVGSINRSYLVDETLSLSARVLARSADSELLILGSPSQHAEYARRVEAAGIESSRVTITSARHDAMPQWLSLLEWGLLLLNPASPAKRASMPTKLAEFLGVGVRPVQFGCNAEVSEWVRRAGSGLVLDDVSPRSLDEAAETMAGPRVASDVLSAARARAQAHFSLECGLNKYDEVLRACFGDPR